MGRVKRLDSEGARGVSADGLARCGGVEGLWDSMMKG